MVNIFRSANDKKFSWEKLGNIKEGRPDLGDHLPVEVYRQLEFSLIEALTKRYGAETSNAIFKEAGAIAGIEFTKKHLNTNASFKDFMTDLYKILYKLRIGILNVEHVEADFSEIIVTLADDLDCSGLPPNNEMICDYDEGFLEGILLQYTGDKYEVTEINCWANGDRICRFRCRKL